MYISKAEAKIKVSRIKSIMKREKLSAYRVSKELCYNQKTVGNWLMRRVTNIQARDFRTFYALFCFYYDKDMDIKETLNNKYAREKNVEIWIKSKC